MTSINNSNNQTSNLIYSKIKYSAEPNNFDIYTLIDTGADNSLININSIPNIVMDYLFKFKEQPDSKRNKWGTQISQYDMIGAFNEINDVECFSLMLKIQIGNWTGHHRFILTNQITENAILGMDFLNQYNWSKDKHGFKILDNEYKIICELKKTIVIPPNSEMIIPAKSNKIFCNKLVIFEPFDHSSQGIIAAKSITNTDDSSVIPIQVYNYSSRPIRLKKNQTIGTAEIAKNITKIDDHKKVNFNDLKSDDQRLFNYLFNSIQVGPQLSTDEKNKLIHLLVKYKDAISLSKNDLGECNVLEHKIDTGDHQPIKQALYKTNLRQKLEMEQHVQEMKDNNIIEPSNSPWLNNPVLVEKKNGEKRFCIDFRALNKVTIKDGYALPRIDEILDTVGSAKLFTTLDLASGFWQVLLDDPSKAKTAFSTILGFFQFRVMPFGLCNAPATFQRLIEKVLTGLNWKQCVAYLDDTVVHARNFKEQLQRLEQVLIRFKTANLKIRIEKCKFAMEEVEFLGFKITKNGLLPCERKIEAIKRMQPPQTKRQVRQLIGFINYYRIFIDNMAHNCSPLYRLTRKNVKFEWSDECQIAFDKIKNMLISAPLLVFPDPNKDFIIECDASQTSIGAALSQDPTRPIALNIIRPIALNCIRITSNDTSRTKSFYFCSRTTSINLVSKIFQKLYIRPPCYLSHRSQATGKPQINQRARRKNSSTLTQDTTSKLYNQVQAWQRQSSSRFSIENANSKTTNSNNNNQITKSNYFQRRAIQAVNVRYVQPFQHHA